MEKPELLILLTNDDGAEARGLLALQEELKNLGRVIVVAPAEERSAVSHALTIHMPIRLIELAADHFALTGTPADCVLFAIRKLLPRPPDLVVSGINHGPNLGDDILYSGTVAGAREAALHSVPAVAVSHLNGRSEIDFEPAARYSVELIRKLYADKIPAGTYLNINLPSGKPRGFRFTRQGSRRLYSSVEEKKDPRGRSYYWIGRDESVWLLESETDYQAIQDGFVSVTPLHRDQTDYRTLKACTEDPAGK